MMPMPYGSFSLQLIALTAGLALFIWSLNSDKSGAFLGRFLGFFIMLLALISVLCTVYAGIKLWMQPTNTYEVVQIQEQTKNTSAPKANAEKASTHKEKSSEKKK